MLVVVVMPAAAALAVLVVVMSVMMVRPVPATAGVRVIVVLGRVRLVTRQRALRMMLMIMVFMIMVMIMPAAAGFIVMMVIVPVAVVIVPVIMGVMRFKVGPAFGIERRLDGAHLAAEALDHRVDDVIAADAQAAAGDLHGEVPVAEVPGEAQQVLGVFGADLAQRFGRADNLHEPPVLQLHRVARAQGDRRRQIEQEGQAADGFHRDAAAMPVVEIEHDGIGGLALPVASGDDIGGAQHGSSPQEVRIRGCRAVGDSRASTDSTGRTSAIIPTTSAGLG